MNNYDVITKWKICIGRELGLRRSVYPKWVKSGRMTQLNADEEINTMSEIYAYFSKLAKECEEV